MIQSKTKVPTHSHIVYTERMIHTIYNTTYLPLGYGGTELVRLAYLTSSVNYKYMGEPKGRRHFERL